MKKVILTIAIGATLFSCVKKSDYEDLKDFNSKLKNEISLMNLTIQSYIVENSNLKAQIAALNAELNNLLDEGLYSARVQELENQLATKSAQIAVMEKKIQELEFNSSDNAILIDEIREALAQRLQEQADLIAQIEELNDAVDNLTSQLADALEEIADLTEELADIDSEEEEYEEYIERLEEEIETLQEQVEELIELINDYLAS